MTLTGNLKKENDRDAWVLWLGLQGVAGEGGAFHFHFKWLKAGYGNGTVLMVVRFISSQCIPTNSVFSWQRTWVTVLTASSECGCLEGQGYGFAPTQSTCVLAWVGIFI